MLIKDLEKRDIDNDVNFDIDIVRKLYLMVQRPVPEHGLAPGQLELLEELDQKRILRNRYESFSINEAWVNRDIVTGE